MTWDCVSCCQNCQVFTPLGFSSFRFAGIFVQAEQLVVEIEYWFWATGLWKIFYPLEMQINILILMPREERDRDRDRESRDGERRRLTFNAHSLHTERGEKGKKDFWKKSSEQFVVPPFLRQNYVSFKNGLSGDRVVRMVASRLVGGRFDSNNCFFNSSLVGGNALKIKMKSWLCCLRVNRAKFRVIL